ncbi:cache domain-containing protein [Wenxinia saemankumensis]|uniref:Two-component system, NarL family, sensor kinase n=1 Tax=Wenxinia saemankumensis TaxID=1447782 RepID=A0A1M6AII4_9RHOB|nr:cache domain-containing protein [Wenxinia saemankumensis]SHI36282.1 two-component system, NarL family, sensor kinase [Wenxinia saemankumensis]
MTWRSALPRRSLPALSTGQKVFLLAAVPLVLASALIVAVNARQTRQLADREIAALEAQMLEATREELRNYVAIARTAFLNVYGRAAPDDAAAKLETTQILASMIYGQDGYFFVFDYDGVNLVAPRQTWLIERDWSGLTDPNGVAVVDELIAIARAGGGFLEFDWPRPSTGETGRMIAYVNGLQDWRWVVGTGVFIDDALASVAAARAEVEARIARTSAQIVAIALVALIGVFATGMVLNLRERRLADAKLRALTERVIDTQEEERGRVARELHDSISQILVGTRYALELARRRLAGGDARAAESLEKGIAGIGQATQEVRRISRDLRPGLLDDLGLGPALKQLAEDFSARTGIETDLETVVFRNRISADARIAFYRVAQEALTNVERHAGATAVAIHLRGHRRGALLRISDDGRGLTREDRRSGGLGLRNMQERMEQLGGSLRLISTARGTVIEAQVPLSHMLPPGSRTGETRPGEAAGAGIRPTLARLPGPPAAPPAEAPVPVRHGAGPGARPAPGEGPPPPADTRKEPA